MNDKKNFYCISSRVETSGQLYGCFKIGPFYGHQSLTFANSLRRTLLANKSKCMFDAIQIYGVEHEFSNLVGVRESAVDILLNLEKLIFSTNLPITKPKIAFVNFCGPGILKGQHIHLPSDFKCVNPSQYIASLEVDGKLTFKLFFTPNWDKLKSQPIYQLYQNKKTELTRRTLGIYNKQIPVSKELAHAFALKRQVGPPTVGKRWRFSAALARLAHSGKRFSAPQSTPPWVRFASAKTHLLFSNTFSQKFIKKKLIYNKNENSYQKFIFKNKFLATKKPICVYKKIQENFLFLKSSSNVIEKVNYTLQSIGSNKHKKTTNSKKYKIINKKNNHINLNCALKIDGTLTPVGKRGRSQSKEMLKGKKCSQLSDIFSGVFRCEQFRQTLNFEQKNINEEFIIFEVWTNGSLHPQTAILKAINELLLEIFPYSLKISKNYTNFNNKSNVLKRRYITNLSKNHFREKFINLEIANFYFDLETLIFLKNKKISRIVDFLNFFKQTKLSTNIWSYHWNKWYDYNLFRYNIDQLNTTSQIKTTLYKFQNFIHKKLCFV
uniref:Plastid-encoded RNA polymerase subunit alpha n=1 Tax=Flabellia petiolata TaxID=189428 RepID=A0A386AX48_9CHLO|nr:RNA polymerase a-subunit [Flabellia petiolata]